MAVVSSPETKRGASPSRRETLPPYPPVPWNQGAIAYEIAGGFDNRADLAQRYLIARDIGIGLDFLFTYINTHLERQGGAVREISHDVVKELCETPDEERLGIYNRFLSAEGMYHSERLHSSLPRLKDPWGEEAREVIFDAMWEFSTAYKKVTMGPLGIMVSDRVIAMNPEYITDAPTASESFEQTINDWLCSAAAEVADENRETTLWQQFKHATEISSVVTYCDKRYAKEAIEGHDYPPQVYSPQTWLEKSFLNTLPFVSDLILEAAVSYARQHPEEEEITSADLTNAVYGWLPYFCDMESAYAHTQDLTIFGRPHAKKIRAHKKENPGKVMKDAPARWLEALKDYETGNQEKLFKCAELFAPSPILQMEKPGPVHHSLRNGALPPRSSGRCHGQFHAETTTSPEGNPHHPETINAPTFSAASTMLLMCAEAAANTLFSDPTCIKAIRDAARVVNETPVAESEH